MRNFWPATPEDRHAKPWLVGQLSSATLLFLDGVYERLPDGTRLRFQWVRAPTSAQLTQLAYTIARRVGRLLEREGLLERDTEQLDLGEALNNDDPMPDLAGHSITYRIAVGPHRGRKVFH